MNQKDYVDRIREQLGLIHLYCGDGKGKQPPRWDWP